MASAEKTTDHGEIRQWVEARGGRPAQVKGTSGLLRIDFDGEVDERIEQISWDDFFDQFDRSNVTFLYAPDTNSHFNKFVNDEAEA